MITIKVYEDTTERAPVPLDFITFPSGEEHVRILEELSPDYRYIITVNFEIGKINADIQRLMFILLAMEGIEYMLDIPFFPFARQDRKAALGDLVTCELFFQQLNAVSAVKNNVLKLLAVDDIHSFNSVKGYPIVSTSDGVDVISRIHYAQAPAPSFIAVAPDEGSVGRLRKILTSMNTTFSSKYHVVYFKKERDPTTGKLNGFSIDSSDTLPADALSDFASVPKDTPVVFFDDICDGGGTFIAEAQILREVLPDNPFYLRVSHGLFTKGTEELKKHFAELQTFNLLNSAVKDSVTVLPRKRWHLDCVKPETYNQITR